MSLYSAKDEICMEECYPEVPVQKKTGNELFTDGSYAHKSTLADFWAWAYSDLVGNTIRGKLAEYIVAMALDVENGIQNSWDSYDLLSPDGIRVEVKASAYLQSWAQKKLSHINFGIRPTHAWDSKTNRYDNAVLRQSDIYVFCILKHTDQTTLNPLDLSQWEFYPLAAEILNQAVAEQKTISLSHVINLGAKSCSYAELNKAIHEQYARFI